MKVLYRLHWYWRFHLRITSSALLPWSYRQFSPRVFQEPLRFLLYWVFPAPLVAILQSLHDCVSFCFSISIIFILTRENWRYLHNPSERELVYFVYPVNTAKELCILVLYWPCTLPTRSSAFSNRFGDELFSLVQECSDIFLCSLFGLHLAIAWVGSVS
jgi:hypothetical protein